MKVIDLLNKIAKGEEVPKKIEYYGKVWIYRKNVQDYIYEKDIEIKYLIQEILNGYNATKDLLFCELEIIEDEDEELDLFEIIEEKPKHIEELDILPDNESYSNKVLYGKINELAKAVNYLLDKEDVNEKNK